MNFTRQRKEFLKKFLKTVKVVERYVGMGGFAEYADKYHESDMEESFMSVSTVLGGATEMKKLRLWKVFSV